MNIKRLLTSLLCLLIAISAQAQIAYEPGQLGYQVLKFDTKEISTEDLKADLENHPNLDYVGFDHIVTFRNTPDDPLYPSGNNGEGVTGVNWDVKMLLLTIKTESQIANAYYYIRDLRQKYNETNGAEGAFVVVSNASFGIDKRFCDELPIWGAAYDALGEVGIINVTATTNGNDTDVDIEGDMPTTCPSDYLIAVTNTSRSDTKVDGAGIGSEHIDLGAPGGAANTGSVTLGSTNSYDESFGGTSSACFKSMELIHGFCQESEGDVAKALSDASDLGRYTLANSLLNVYPNPASDILNIDFSIRDFGEVTLQMHHVSGAFIFEEKVDVQLFDQQKWTLDVSNLVSGTYILTIQNGKNPVSRKVFVF